MENIMSIDIGTGFAKAAIYFAGQKEPMLLIPRDMPMGIRSIAYVNANGEVSASSRGRPANCTPVRNIKTRFGERSISVSVGRKTFHVEPGKLYGEIARELITVANNMLVENGKKPGYKVIVTYPAAFIHSENPRLTTRNVELMRQSIEALTIDGNKIEVVKMLPEPVAAAYESICYERNVKENPVTDQHYNILVYDVGHGTFDVAVVTSTDDKDTPFDVIAQSGDCEVGGRIFDDKIYADQCRKLGHPDKIKLTARDQEELHYTKAVEMKHNLTNTDCVRDNFFPEDGDGFVELSMTKAEFEKLIETDLNRTLIKTVEALEYAKSKNITVNEIVLTGGSSRIEAIERMLKKAFAGQNINIRPFRPEHAVVFGAARYAYNMEKAPVTQHAEYSYGIFMDENSRVKFLVDSEDELPRKSRTFEITPDYCSMSIRVCRSKSRICSAKDLDYKVCHEIRRFRFDTTANKVHKLRINIDDTHKVSVECEYPDGSKITKSRIED